MSNNGVIIERLGRNKLIWLVSTLAILQTGFFLLGALKFPHSTHTETVEGIMCKDKQMRMNVKEKQKSSNNLYYLRDYMGRMNSNCERVDVDENRNTVLDARQDEIVYAFQIPLPRDDRVLRMSRLFQTMTSILQLQVIFPPKLNNKDAGMFNEISMEHTIPLKVDLAYRNRPDYDDAWHLINSANITKHFSCVKSQYSLDCDMVQLFELGSVHHEFYLINIKLGQSDAVDSIKLYDTLTQALYMSYELPEVRLVLTFIYQTGGFTLMWLIIKTCMLPFVFLVTCWYWNRIVKLARQSNMLERMLLALGISAILLNLPVEWLTLKYDCKWMLIYTDLRQGIFYSVLFTFWIVFCGEHIVSDQGGIKSYWKYIGAVWIGSLALLAFELAQRGMQLSNPFYSVWETDHGSNLAQAFLIIACSSGVLYFLLLMYLIVQVIMNFRSKQSQLPAMNHLRRAFYEGIIYRFWVLLGATVVCAAMTVAFFIVNNLNESHWRFDSESMVLNYTGGFFTGVYGMWNLYTIAVMILYAPSHKNKPDKTQDANNEDTTELVNMETRLSESTGTTHSILSAFANKIASS